MHTQPEIRTMEIVPRVFLPGSWLPSASCPCFRSPVTPASTLTATCFRQDPVTLYLQNRYYDSAIAGVDIIKGCQLELNTKITVFLASDKSEAPWLATLLLWEGWILSLRELWLLGVPLCLTHNFWEFSFFFQFQMGDNWMIWSVFVLVALLQEPLTTETAHSKVSPSRFGNISGKKQFFNISTRNVPNWTLFYLERCSSRFGTLRFVSSFIYFFLNNKRREKIYFKTRMF